MKKSVRKWLATALSLCLLAAMLPLSALGVNAGLSVFRVNFDDGNVVFSVNAEDTAVIEDGTLHWTTVAWKNLSKSFNGVVGVEHTLTFRAKAASDATVKYIFLDGSWQNTAAPTYAPTITTEWTTYTYQFTPDYAGMVLILQSEKATDIWLDDISITVETSDGNVPAIPTDAVYGEDFEDGALNGWTSNNSIVSSSAVPVPDAGAGNYSMKFSSTNYSYTN